MWSPAIIPEVDMALPKRKNIRLKEYDYSQNGAYFVTICTGGRKQLLWRVGATCGRPQDRILSSIGKLVDNEIKKLSSVYENVSIAKSVIMPNHVHMIILIANDNGRPKEPQAVKKGTYVIPMERKRLRNPLLLSTFHGIPRKLGMTNWGLSIL